MDIPGPWTFKLRNPRNPTQNVSHAGVLEFIAEEGIVHLPAWVSSRSRSFSRQSSVLIYHW
jgi:ubiquitin fusion degradation protein 1